MSEAKRNECPLDRLVMPRLLHGDCLERMKDIPDGSVDAIVTDPPYGLSFMGKEWDRGVPGVHFWREMIRVLKPGGYLLSFSGTRTYHRMACAIEDGGFEIRDMIEWVYGSGFPKSLNIGKAVDKLDAVEIRNNRKLSFTEWMRGTGLTSNEVIQLTGKPSNGNHLLASNLNNAGIAIEEDFVRIRTHLLNKGIIAPEWIEKLVYERTVESENFKKREVVGERKQRANSEDSNIKMNGCPSEVEIVTKGASEWEGWGTALKPAHEPICMARKPLAEKTVAENVLKYGTGGINIDESRVGTEVMNNAPAGSYLHTNIINDGRSKEVIDAYIEKQKTQDGTTNIGRFPANLIHDNSEEVRECFPETKSGSGNKNTGNRDGIFGKLGKGNGDGIGGDSGNASRFFKSIPNHEPICMARKPLAEKTVAENVLKYGTGGINIDESRVDVADSEKESFAKEWDRFQSGSQEGTVGYVKQDGEYDLNQNRPQGRFPANLIHDNSEEVRECFPETGKGNGKGAYNYAGREYDNKDTSMFNGDKPQAPSNFNDSGNASRFFKSIIYQAKASKSERNAGLEGFEAKFSPTMNDGIGMKEHNPETATKKQNHHPTVKPIKLMQYLVRLITPKGGIVLDPFMGSGTTGIACKNLNRDFIGIELDEQYFMIAQERIEAA